MLPSARKASTKVPVLTPLVEQKEATHEVMDELLLADSYALVLLDDTTLGLVVDGCLLAEYSQTSTYTKGSFAGRTRLEAAVRQAQRANNLVRSFVRASQGSPKIHPSVDEEPAPIVQPIEDPGIERFIGQISDATSAERANMRDKRPHRDLLGMIPEPQREVVEGND